MQKKVEKAYKDAELYKQIADIYFIAELYDKAKQQYENAYNMNKDDDTANVWKEISSDMAKVDKNPKDANAWHRIGLSYTKLSLYDKAIDAFKKAIELEPKKRKYHYNLASTPNDKNSHS